MVEPDNSLSLAISRELRTDQRKQLTLLLRLVDAAQRYDRRFSEIDRRFSEVDRRFSQLDIRLSETRDEIELMLKSELMGRLTHFETQGNERIAQLDDRLAAQENGRG